MTKTYAFDFEEIQSDVDILQFVEAHAPSLTWLKKAADNHVIQTIIRYNRRHMHNMRANVHRVMEGCDIVFTYANIIHGIVFALALLINTCYFCFLFLQNTKIKIGFCMNQSQMCPFDCYSV